jgi:serine protease Do
LKVPVVEQQLSEIDDVASLVDPQKSLVQELGILGLDVSGKVADLIGELRVGSGVVVAALAAESGVDSGLQPGDVIHSLNGAPIRTLAELRTCLAALKPGDPVALHLERDGRLMYLAFELE